MAHTIFAYRNQPWKFLYYATQIPLLLFVKVPFWIILYIPRSFRPVPSWPLRRCVVVNILRTAAAWGHTAGPIRPGRTFEAITEGEGVKGVWVKPVPELVVGEIEKAAEINGVPCVRIPGYWLDKPGLEDVKPGASPIPGEKVLYCLHGGGYISHSAHPSDFTANIPHSLLPRCPSVTRAFSIEYRLTKTFPFKPTGSFPSALLDALAGYMYLIKDVGFDPKDIILEGDSAGGGLAQALVRYLVQYADHSSPGFLPPPPGALILLSSLTDMGASHRDSESFQRNLKIDYVNFNPARKAYINSGFTGALDPNSPEINPYFSPGSKNPELADISFKGFPKTLIVAGEYELIKASIICLKDKMTRQLGEDHVTYIETPNGVHDFIIIRRFGRERDEALKQIAEWISML